MPAPRVRADAGRDARRGVVSRLLVAAIRLYQASLSPLLPAGCRYTPSCSEYARQAIERFGAARGAWLALGRLARCHPLGGFGADPVPPAASPTGAAASRDAASSR